MAVSFKGREVRIVTLDLNGFKRMAQLQDMLLAPMPDSMEKRADALIEIAAGLACLFAPSISREEAMSATFADLAAIITEGTKINNPGPVFARPAPPPNKPKFSSAIANMAHIMGDEKAERRIRSKQRAEEIIRLHEAGQVPVA